jgi:hypothetical protein
MRTLQPSGEGSSQGAPAGSSEQRSQQGERESHASGNRHASGNSVVVVVVVDLVERRCVVVDDDDDEYLRLVVVRVRRFRSASPDIWRPLRWPCATPTNHQNEIYNNIHNTMNYLGSFCFVAHNTCIVIQ